MHIVQPTRDNPSDVKKPPIVLTIAGFDPSSGAGITADLQVFAAHGLFGTAAITALTVQSTRGVAAVEGVRPEVLRHTLEHLVSDLPPQGIKIGMLGSRDVVRVVAEFLRSLSDFGVLENIPVVLDPVLRSSSGSKLLEEDASTVLRDELLPWVSWLTPNLNELQQLTGVPREDARGAIVELASGHSRLQVVATGGDERGEPKDIWRSAEGDFQEFTGTRVETRSTHGTGCAFSSALLSELVCGQAPLHAIVSAKRYVEGALREAPGLGGGAGPMHLLWPLCRC